MIYDKSKNETAYCHALRAAFPANSLANTDWYVMRLCRCDLMCLSRCDFISSYSDITGEGDKTICKGEPAIGQNMPRLRTVGHVAEYLMA